MVWGPIAAVKLRQFLPQLGLASRRNGSVAFPGSEILSRDCCFFRAQGWDKSAPAVS
jgi:hypothetical protein